MDVSLDQCTYEINTFYICVHVCICAYVYAYADLIVFMQLCTYNIANNKFLCVSMYFFHLLVSTTATMPAVRYVKYQYSEIDQISMYVFIFILPRVIPIS